MPNIRTTFGTTLISRLVGNETKRGLVILVLWTLVLLGLLLTPIGELETRIPGGFRHWDKIAHVGLFGITGLVGAYGGKILGPPRTRILFGLIFGLLLAVFTEGAQYLIGFRSGSFYDLLADVAGLSLALLLYALLHLR